MNEFVCHHCGETIVRDHGQPVYCGKKCVDERMGEGSLFWGKKARSPNFLEVRDKVEAIFDELEPCSCKLCAL